MLAISGRSVTMRSSFFGMEIMRRSLQAQRVGLEVTSHNIANANTPGYSRQVVNLRASSPFPYPTANYNGTGQLGTGVDVSEVKRMRNDFVEAQIRKETQSLGYWNTVGRNIWQVEMIINEPSENGLSASLQRYWESWQMLAGEAEDGGHRAPVAQRANELAATFRHTRDQLVSLKKDTDDSIGVKAEQINGLARELAAVNKQISRVDLMGQEPNDLLDRRDQILRDLSNITNISVIDGRQQTVTVQINGTSLVDFDTVNEIEIIKPKSNDEVTRLVWSKGKAPVTFNGGEIKGLIETRDGLLTQNIKNLDTMAKALIDATNAIHRVGFGLDNSTGLSFFDADSTDASNIKVAEAILQNPSKIAASTKANAPGNGDNALAIAEILNKPILNGNTTTINAYLDGMVAKLGVQGQEASRTIDNQETLVHYLNIEQNQYTSVSLDEEMANMMKYQHAYNAAARMVSTLDDALDTIISRMGIVGR